jgi:hypothetical protein
VTARPVEEQATLLCSFSNFPVNGTLWEDCATLTKHVPFHHGAPFLRAYSNPLIPLATFRKSKKFHLPPPDITSETGTPRQSTHEDLAQHSDCSRGLGAKPLSSKSDGSSISPSARHRQLSHHCRVVASMQSLTSATLPCQYRRPQ